MQSLRAEAPTLSHREVRTRMGALGREHDVTLPDAYLELLSRLTKDKDFYRHHPAHAAWWLLRYARPAPSGDAGGSCARALFTWRAVPCAC